MTILVGNKRVKKIVAGGNVFVSREDVWLECKTDNVFSGIPILMKYDKTTGIASFLGGQYASWSPSEEPWHHLLLQLPEGFHFASVDPKIGVYPGGNPLNLATFPIELTNGKLFSNFKWAFGTTNTTSVYLSFGSVSSVVAGAKSSVWQTTTVVPD
ncbi:MULTISPECIES: hypothetical protein [Lactobacillaceae]|uniref:hypothetical protein n=1 Tax=Lactobacillaceae TaxID=33958 RepID=UPI00145661FF|nr:hypothetical protein [Lactobacillus sp. HBUAS51381]NLR08653.1 hypothetical protein [Lactobacillus sp. HBUAS51381]